MGKIESWCYIIRKGSDSVELSRISSVLRMGKAPIWTVRTQSLEEREIYALIPEINYAEEDSTIPLDGVPIFSTLHEVLVFMWFKVPQCVVIFSDDPFPSNASEMPILVLDERLKKKVPRRIFFTSPMSLLDLIFISEL